MTKQHRKNLNTPKLWLLKYLLVVVFAICGCTGAKYQKKQVQLDSGWEYYWRDTPLEDEQVRQWITLQENKHWPACKSSLNPPSRSGHEYLWLRVRLPTVGTHQPSLMIQAVDLVAEVYIVKPDVRLVYRSETSTSTFAQQSFSGWRPHHITLPEESLDSVIFFRVKSNHSNIGLYGSVMFGDASDLLTEMFHDDLPRLFVSLTILVLGLIQGLLFLGHKRQYFLFLSSLFCLINALYGIVFYSGHRFHGGFLLFVVEIICAIVSWPIFCALVYNIFVSSVKVCVKVLSYPFYLLGTAFLATATIPSLGYYMVTIVGLTQKLFVVFLMIVIVLSMFELKRASKEGKVLIFGLLGMAVFCMHAVLVQVGFLPWREPLSYLIQLPFVIVLCAIGLNRFISAHRTLEKYTEELEKKNTKVLEQTQELQKTTGTLQALVLSSPTAIITLDRSAHVTMWNPAARETFGFDEDEVIGKLNPVVAVGTMGSETAPFGLPLSPEYIHIGSDFQTTTRDGKIIDISLSSAPLRDDAGKFIGIVGIMFDRTEHVLLEAQLRQSQKMDAIGKLAGGIAHDFNNLMTIILGTVDIARDSLGPSLEQNGYLDEITVAADRASDLTKQLLAFSRKQLMEVRHFDLNELVRSLTKMLKRLLRENLTLRLSLVDETAGIRADPGRIEQIIINLVVNAQDAITNVGEISITTRQVVIDEVFRQEHTYALPGTYFVLVVCDTGCGMTADVMNSVFEPFFTTKDPGKGTGLGLSTVFGIVKQLGGFIEVSSQKGKGSTFEVYFPKVSVSNHIELQEQNAPATRGSETILLVEDESSILKVMAKSLSRLGYKILSASSGHEALEIAELHNGNIDLLITDVILPKMNGKALADILTDRLKGLRVLFTSGYTDDVISKQGILQDGINFLSKPYTPYSLSTAIRRVINIPKRPS